MATLIEVKISPSKFCGAAAVNGISFAIEEGKITGLLGPNGAGKTTTIQMILDLVTPGGRDFYFREGHAPSSRRDFAAVELFIRLHHAAWKSPQSTRISPRSHGLYGVRDRKKRKRIIELAEFWNHQPPLQNGWVAFHRTAHTCESRKVPPQLGLNSSFSTSRPRH